MLGMHARLVLVFAFALGFLGPTQLHAAEAVAASLPAAATAAATTAAGLLAEADAAIEAGELPRARFLFQRLTVEFPTAPEANEARRALRIFSGLESPGSGPVAGGGEVVVRNEPYSRKTSERLRLTIWEKVDFGVTSFLYGMSVGLSFALSQEEQTTSSVLTPMAVGAVVYTLGAVAFLNFANPDRGDLPLTLAITSYIPTTMLMAITAADPDASGRTLSTLLAVSGVVSIPTAVLAAHYFDLDPGDTQLVRDAGFWGLVLSTVGTLGFGGSREAYYGGYQKPSGRTIAVAGLVGLYGGLGLGLLGASVSEVSLERVRVTTWGGYGGAVVGLLLGAAASGDNTREKNIYRGTVFGALAGLAITFFTTGGLDGIPEEEPKRTSWYRRLTPTMVPMAGSNGSVQPGFGLAGMLD
jgi:hypothetical protein